MKNIKEQLVELKKIPLPTLLGRVGYTLCSKKSSKRLPVFKKGPTKLLLLPRPNSFTGYYQYQNLNTGQLGTCYDLALLELGVATPSEVLEYLKSTLGDIATRVYVQEPPPPPDYPPLVVCQRKALCAWRAIASHSWTNSYLTNKRKIAPSLCTFYGNIKSDNHAVYTRTRLDGIYCSVHSHGARGSWAQKGVPKGLAILAPQLVAKQVLPTQFIVCESVIDGLSYVQLYKDILATHPWIIATMGRPSRAALSYLQRIAEGHPKAMFKLTFDGDEAGRALSLAVRKTALLKAAVDDVMPPLNVKDWNEALQLHKE